MVKVYNSKTVLDMPEEEKEAIRNAGVPLSIYENGYCDIGASNNSSLTRFREICKQIRKNKLPIPPSPFVEFVVEKTTGTSKQDFAMTIDARKGAGKSYSSAYIAGRYAIEIATRRGHDPKDYFSIDNCALLEDTEGITKIVDEAEKHQVLIIDDAGTAIGSRDFAQEKNKNFNKILTVCRTKRWFVILNSPMATHLDLQVRELVDASAHIYKSFHDLGFNLVKINSTESKVRFGKKKIYERRFSFHDRKFDFWCAYSPDILDPFKGFTTLYDAQRDAATDRLIHSITVKEKERGVSTEEKRRQKLDDLVKQHGANIVKWVDEGRSARFMTSETGLTDHMIGKIKARMKNAPN